MTGQLRHESITLWQSSEPELEAELNNTRPATRAGDRAKGSVGHVSVRNTDEQRSLFIMLAGGLGWSPGYYEVRTEL
jgi:hypothetical protein